jgi:hypothetical protein
MRTLWIVPIEPIETRYTKHWYEYLPDQFRENTKFDRVIQIELPLEDTIAPENSAGGFFNFGFTCAFKSKQTVRIAELFTQGQVKENDVFLYTDYWNPAALFTRYMSAMTKIPIKMVGICHAGLWDPADMLSQNFGGKMWGEKLEESLDEAFDLLFFATKFSKNLYEKEHGGGYHHMVTGFPMEYYPKVMANYWDLENPPEKENIVVFPHRKAPEKNIDLFYKLAELLPEYKFVVAMDVCKNKEDYHNLMYRSKVSFSAATQETLGISMGIESLIAQCIPAVPDRLSYSELFSHSNFLHNEEIEKDLESLSGLIKYKMENYELFVESIKKRRKMSDRWFDGAKMYDTLNTCAYEKVNCQTESSSERMGNSSF